MDELGSKDSDLVFHEVKTKEQATAYMEELTQQVELARAQLDGVQLVRVKTKAFHNLLIRYGRALGAVTTLVHTGVLPREDYTAFASRIHGAIVPSLVV